MISAAIQVFGDSKVALHRAKMIFGSTCLLLATYMTLTQVIRYLENGDASSITHKQFNRKERDQYPTYSVCLKGKEVYWAHENSMFEELGITSSQYADTLKGIGWKYTYDEGARFYRKEDFNLRNVSTIELKKFSPNPRIS